MQLLETTQALLDKAKAAESLAEIARKSEGKVDYEWLVKFSAGKVENPGVLNVQSLHDFLKRHKPKKAD